MGNILVDLMEGSLLLKKIDNNKYWKLNRLYKDKN